jgi:ATP-dependent RNA helicase RhlB
MYFNALNLHERLQQGIDEMGFTEVRPVQEQVIAALASGRDLYVQSQTGTGKTAAYLIVIFQRLLTEEALRGRKALVMVPTRELAVQVEEEALQLGKYLPFKVASFYGGVGYGAQQQSLKDDAQVLVGTPGRVLDLCGSGVMNLADTAFLVIDEADRMFDMGFYPDLRKLLKVVPPADRRQTMLFSATLNTYVKNLALDYTKDPLEIEIAPETVTVEEVKQLVYHVPSERKFSLLLGILRHENPDSTIVFCNTKRYTEIIAKRLRKCGIECEFIMGDLPQTKRLSIIAGLKSGKHNFLVATDVAARGLDVEDLSLVVNYDIPNEKENYVHRIGRTARAGKSGLAITLASEKDVYDLTAIERFIGMKLPAEVPPDDLYADDASAGMGPGHDKNRAAPRRRDAPPPRAERQSSRGPEPRKPSGRSFPAERGSGQRTQHTQRTQQVEQRSSVPRKPLSEMSESERREYYKEKYGGGANKARAQTPRREGAVTGGASKKRKRGGKGKTAATQSPAPKKAQTQKPSAFTKQASTKPVGASKEKKGLLSVLKSLFKKKN